MLSLTFLILTGISITGLTNQFSQWKKKLNTIKICCQYKACALVDQGTPPFITAAVLWVAECDQMYVINNLLFQAELCHLFLGNAWNG